MTILFIILTVITILFFTLYIKNNRKKNTTIDSFNKHMESFEKKLFETPTDKQKIIDYPISFGYKCMWFAIKSGNKDKIISKLNYTKIDNCNWSTGIERAYKGAIFLTPKIGNWTLVYGNGITIDGGSINEIESIKNMLIKLSNEFGEAQFFNTHRIVEYHCWIKAINGKIKRAYAFLGESCKTIINEGEPTDIESKHNLINTFSEESKIDGYFDREDICFPNELLLMEIANSWSVNPSELENRNDIKNELGILLK